MSKPVEIPEITILPSTVATDQPGTRLYRWEMKLLADSRLDSEDHGDDFYSVQEALAQAYSVFEDLVTTRHIYPARTQQEFKLTIISG